MTELQRIFDFLKNNPRYSYNAPTIYKHFKGDINLSTIRCHLRRLHEQKKILRETHGFYRVRLDPEILYYLERPPTLLHGIMVSMKWHRIMQKDIHGISAPNYNKNIIIKLEHSGFKVTGGRNKNRLFKRFCFDNDVDRVVTITVHLGGRLDIYVNCSGHPVSFFEFRDMLNFCQGMVDFLGPFGEQRVVQFGVAKDFREVRMEGVNSLTLRAFMDSWFRVYNKERLGVTRMEQHVRCNVPVSEFVSMFERMFLPVGNGHGEDTFEDVV